MLLDKFETYIINIVGLKSRSTRKHLIKVCKDVKFLRFISIFNNQTRRYTSFRS